MKFTYLLGAVLALGLVPGRAAADVPSLDDGNSPRIKTLNETAATTEENVTVVKTEQKREKKGMEGLSISGVGGVEGYTSALAPRIKTGGAWGARVDAMPVPYAGLELEYSGADNRIKDPTASGGRIVRNGGQAALKIEAPLPIAPYVFGGVGVERANVTRVPEGSAYRSDTYGQVPLGGGLDFRVGAFTAGVRGSYNILFSRNFTPTTTAGGRTSGNTWNATGNIGAVF
jgi:hypothetical protein